jgi:hypothetical protein
MRFAPIPLAWRKVVFLSEPLAAGFFPLRKGNSSTFFTVKQFFFKIKVWPGRPGPIWQGKDSSKHEEA